MDKYPIGIMLFDYSSCKLHFLDQGTVAKRGEVTCFRSHGETVAGLELELCIYCPLGLGREHRWPLDWCSVGGCLWAMMRVPALSEAP